MKLTFSIIASLALAFACHAQTNVIFGTIADIGVAPQPGQQVTLTLVTPNPHPSQGNAMIVVKPKTTSTDSVGAFWFTNILWGKYTLSAVGTQWPPLYVGTNTVGSVPIASLVTNSAALPPNPGTNYYTQAQVDALLAGFQPSGSSLWSSDGNSIYPSGSTGTGGGWISTGGSIYPQ